MGILDDAIREHLDLKRKHGARDSEISEIEDEALGSGERPDPFAAGELFGGVSQSAPGEPEQAGPPTSPRDDLVDQPSEEPTALVEPRSAPPEPPPARPPEPSFPEPPDAEALDADLPPASQKPDADLPPAPEAPDADPPSAPEPPAESESLDELMAQEAEAGPPQSADVEVPPPPPPESEAPARPEQPPPAATEGQRGRALGRADVPTQEHTAARRETGEDAALSSEPEPLPSGPTPSEPEPSSTEPEPSGQGDPQLYDFETDPGLVEEEAPDPGIAPPPPAESDDFEALGPAEEEPDEAGGELYLDEEEEPHGEQRGGTTDFEEVEAVEEDYKTEVRPVEPVEEEDDEGFRTEVRPAESTNEEDDQSDLLSGSPEFLDEEDDESLWFEKGPPKDFDFEDEDD